MLAASNRQIHSLWRGGPSPQINYSKIEEETPTMDPDFNSTTESPARFTKTSFNISNREEASIDQLDLDEDSAENGAATRRDKPFLRSLKAVATLIGLLLGFILCFTTIQGNRHINQTLAVTVWMATLWLTEVIPLVVTAFLPLILLPLFGIMSSSDTAAQYINDTFWLFVAGFMIALTLERWGLHRRFSLLILTRCGTRPPFLLLGMMCATFLLSMFVSNTATTLMMLPNAISVVTALEDSGSLPRHCPKFGEALLLGIAYSASVGGMSSLIGTGPNLVLHRQLMLLFPDAPEITFAQWIAFGLPTGLVFLVIIWGYLCVTYLMNLATAEVDPTLFIQAYKALGAWKREQIMVCALFFFLCLLWIFRSDLDLGYVTIPGWANIFPQPSYISDATAGMLVACILFVFPARSTNLDKAEVEDIEMDYFGGGRRVPSTFKDDKNDTTLLNWETANKMPYDVIFLLGGGFALAQAFVESGLSEYLGNSLASLNLSVMNLVFLLVTMIIWLTELTSNTSTSNIMIPIAASMAVATKTSPYTFMIPATMACTCAFVLPIATPPNMVVFSTGRLPMWEMNKAGIFLNLIGSVLLLMAAYTIIPAVLGVGAEEYPSWAAQ
jgi:solute carrier family 13 (sodium-dependent dicarboxylate transporter), member 2/3/5